MNLMKTKVIFMGTPQFAKQILEILLTLPYLEIIGVVCQPDRKIGRKKILTISAVKELALQHNLLIFQPENINNIIIDLKKIQPDWIITCAYGQFLKDEVLNLSTKGCLNVHASLLPKLRGGAPIHWAVINDEKVTGISLMQMIKKMDAGPIFIQESINLDSEETTMTLYNKLIVLAQDMLKKYLFLIINGKIKPQLQNEKEVTYGLNISRENEKINWYQDARKVTCLIRGLFDKPLAYSTINGKIYKIHKAYVFNKNKKEAIPGTILDFNSNGIEVQTLLGTILIIKLQPESKVAIDLKDCYEGILGLSIGMKFI